MSKIIERSVAEIIIITVVALVLFSSCGSAYHTGGVNPTYGKCKRR
jgi:hypothetical protein